MRIPNWNAQTRGTTWDGVEIGCNTVLNPGVIVAPHTHVFPAKTVSGYM